MNETLVENKRVRIGKSYIYHKDEDAIDKISDKLYQVIDDDTVYACIGTPRVVGDAIAPRIGSALKCDLKHRVYGTECEPLNGSSIRYEVPKITEKHKKIIAIDACVGCTEDIGKIIIRDGYVEPGKGAGKDYPYIGNYSILAVVTDNVNNLFNIQNDIINDMAETIVKSIKIAENKKNKKN